MERSRLPTAPAPMRSNEGSNLDLASTAVMIIALTTLVLICGYFVAKAFGSGSAAGLRSLSAVLLPFVVGAFVVSFRRELLAPVASLPPVIAFAGALGFGILVMLLIEGLDETRQVPVAELVVASGLSLFVYSPGAVRPGSHDPGRRNVWMAYYFGTVAGMLGYVVLLGLPFGNG